MTWFSFDSGWELFGFYRSWSGCEVLRPDLFEYLLGILFAHAADVYVGDLSFGFHVIPFYGIGAHGMNALIGCEGLGDLMIS